MRKLILEIVEDSLGLLQNSPLKAIQSNEVLRLLRFDGRNFAAIMKIVFKDQSTKIEEIIPYANLENVKVEVLEQEENGTVYFVKGTLSARMGQYKFLSAGGYFLTPLEIIDGKLRMTFLGKPKQLKALLNLVDELGVRYKVVLLSNASFSADSPLDCLTRRQRQVLVASFNNGYYDIPRRTSSEELAKKLGLKNSALIEHRRKAERRLLASILNPA